MRRILRPAFLIALLVALWAVAVPQLAAAQALPAPAETEVYVSARTMQHILARHGPESDAPGAGKYAPGTTPDMIRAMITEAVQRGRPSHNSNGRPGTLYDYGFPDDIGTTIDGRPTRHIRVVVAQDGYVITAFPR
ncbi:MAG: hypothetical protein JO255_15715 [Alphaproteobacteria bacterium]|nr:hypothetical protein [Alphaproteobacteria bacterium]